MRLRRTGFMVLEAVGGLLLVAALATVLAVAAGRNRQAQQKLSDSRAAIRLAERVLAELQSGGDLPAGDAETTVAARRVEGGANMGEFGWIEANVSVRGQRASVIGVAPLKMIEKGVGR